MAYVTTLSRDHRVGVRDEGITTSINDFQEAQSAIEALDGKSRTQIVLEGTDKALIVGGGNNGLYNVIVAVGTDQAFFNLVKPNDVPRKSHKLIIGGQEGVYKDRQCVDFETVLKAANEFFQTGELASNLTWEE